MPTYASRRSYSPEDSSYYYSYAPQTTTATGMKSVGFASNPVSSSSRPLTQTESRPLYDFEMHARNCRCCNDPLSVHRSQRRLCTTGTGLAAGVTGRFYSSRDGSNICAVGDRARANVELPYTYPQTKSLLRAVERGDRYPRQAPIIADKYASTRLDDDRDENRRLRRTSRFDQPSSYSPPRTGRTRSSSFRADRDDRMPSLTRSPSPTPLRRRSTNNERSSGSTRRSSAFLPRRDDSDNMLAATESLSHGLASLAVRSQSEDLSARLLRESPTEPAFASRRYSSGGAYADYSSVYRAPRVRRGS